MKQRPTVLRRPARLALIVLAGAVAAAFPAADAEQPRTPTAVARQEAESNVRTPAGRAYEGVSSAAPRSGFARCSSAA